MRAKAAIALALVSAMALGASLVACVDLFHSTEDIASPCEMDAQGPGCVPDAMTPLLDGGADGATDFCAWSPDEARQHAAHACAWLGACETPTGGNAFGPCMFQALLAYDCADNPNHPVRGKARAGWDCLWRAQSCAEVAACTFPGSQVSCGTPGANYTACGGQAGGPSSNVDVRVECVNGAAHGENCSLWGKTCASSGGHSACTGGAAGPGGACMGQECAGAALHFCADAGDLGIDCASSGAEQCRGVPNNSQAQWLACTPTSDAGACSPSMTPRCSGGTAFWCLTGVDEQIDCQDLLLPGGARNACTPQPNSPPFDWTSACVASPPVPPCDSDASDFCDGGTAFTSCARGVPFVVDCQQVDPRLGACKLVTTDEGTAQHAACSVSP